jgi:cation-transporting ATPase E
MGSNLSKGDFERGLTAAEVQLRVAAGRVNLAPASASPPVRRILARNLLSPVNLIFGLAALAVVAAGAGLDALFLVPLIFNIVVGTTEELLAKRQLDRLTLLITPRVTVRRDGTETAVRVDQVVADDLCVLRPGDQVVADGPLVEAGGLEMDEASLTGESEPVVKRAGEKVESGTFVVAGSGVYRAERVGKESTAARLVAEAQARPETRSLVQRDLVSLLLRILAIGAPVIALYVITVVAHHLAMQDAVRGTAAAIVSLLPEGLLLLTSTRLALGVVRLARRGLLATRLDAVETIARIDMLCLDKTGTITENRLGVVEVMTAPGVKRGELEAALTAYGAADPTPNSTVRALAAAFPAGAAWTAETVVPFSSARRWSGLAVRNSTDNEIQAWVLGAPEALGGAGDLTNKVDRAALKGHRVVLIGRVNPASLKPGGGLPAIKLLGAVVLDDVVRAGAAETLDYFREQSVTLKLISGDNTETARALGARVGLTGSAASGIEIAALADPEQAAATAHAQIFGRVTPQQKRVIIESLRRQGHRVAMTGDGVNDVLALRAADLGIALQEGTAAAQAVAKLVMLSGAFGALPSAVREGRRIIEGITVGARLFLLKSFYSLTLTAGITLVALLSDTSPSYPLTARNFSILASFAVGIPALILSVVNRQPNPPAARLVPELLRLTIPGGAIAGTFALAAFTLTRNFMGASLIQSRSVTTLVLAIITLTFIPCAEVASASGRRRLKLSIWMAIGLASAFPIAFATPLLRVLYDLTPLPANLYFTAAITGAIGALVLIGFTVAAHPKQKPV